MTTTRYRPRPFIWYGNTAKCHTCGKPIIETDSVFLKVLPGRGEVYYHNRCYLKEKPNGEF